MRKLKFRAWNGKKMFYTNDQHTVWVGGKCASINGSDLAQKETIEYENVMQFTGLLDKNSKEIYEGDILTDNIVVKWRDDWASFALDKYGWMHDHYFGEGVNAKDIEIIGNIYENPDLLTTPRKD